jgi:hypothetical protein
VDDTIDTATKLGDVLENLQLPTHQPNKFLGRFKKTVRTCEKSGNVEDLKQQLEKLDLLTQSVLVKAL